MPPKLSVNRIFSILFVTGLVFIAFVAGAVSLNYRLWIARPVVKAITAAEALRAQSSGEGSFDPTADPAQFLAAQEETITKGQVQWNRDTASGGYTLFTVRYSTRAYLVDMEGHIVHTWDIPFKKAFPNPTHIHRLANPVVSLESARMFPNGDLIVTFAGWRDTPYGYGIAKIDKDSRVLWAYAANVHHGFTIDGQNGNVYTLSHQFIETPIDGLPGLAMPVLADSIITLSPDGKELDRVSVLEAFRDSPFVSMLYHRPISGVAWDLLHTNAVEKLEPAMAPAFPMFRAGDLVISIRNMNTVAVIDPRLRQVKWAYNGLWLGQHAVHFLGSGRLLLLDNFGYYINGKASSRALEFDPATLQVTWQYGGGESQPLDTHAYGRTQRLSNGHTLIVETLGSRILEVGPDGQIAWEFKLPQLFKPFNPAQPPYKGRVGEADNTTPNLANAILDASRYAPDQALFMKK